jgi:hypothetical protein
VAYRVNALFNDGCVMITDLNPQPTPMLRQRIYVQRGGRTVGGIVTAIRKCPPTFLHLPTESIDEVQFRETLENVVVPFPPQGRREGHFS